MTPPSQEEEAAACPEAALSLAMLASGSKGNAIYVSNGETSVLIDAGLSGSELQRRMVSRNLTAERLDAIIVSHEHSDHVAGVGVLARRFGIPVYINQRTLAAAKDRIGPVKSVVHFECGSPFQIKSLTCHPFSISHDAEDPAGFTIQHNGSKIGIATDLGIVTKVVREHLKQCRAVVLEANHDPEMLIKGPYSWPLKQRIKGRTGHLSNEESRDLISEIRHDHLSHVILAHMSEENNTAEKAISRVNEALFSGKTRLTMATQAEGTPLIHVERIG